MKTSIESIVEDLQQEGHNISVEMMGLLSSREGDLDSISGVVATLYNLSELTAEQIFQRIKHDYKEWGAYDSCGCSHDCCGCAFLQHVHLNRVYEHRDTFLIFHDQWARNY